MKSILFSVTKMYFKTKGKKNILKRESLIFQVVNTKYYIFHLRKEKKITHCEVLSRLIHIEIRNIAHAQFIYITEIKELMENLGIISFERVCKFTVQNKDSISVNFLTNKMLNNDIFANVMNTIKNMELNQKI